MKVTTAMSMMSVTVGWRKRMRVQCSNTSRPHTALRRGLPIARVDRQHSRVRLHVMDAEDAGTVQRRQQPGRERLGQPLTRYDAFGGIEERLPRVADQDRVTERGEAADLRQQPPAVARHLP